MRQIAIALLLVLIPLAQAAVNAPLDYDDSVELMEDLESFPGLVSGRATMNNEGVTQATMLLRSDGATVQGMDRVCWKPNGATPECHEGGAYTLEVEQESSFVFQSPQPYDLDFNSAHVLGFFVDAAAVFGLDREETLSLGPSMMAIPTNGQTSINGMTAVPTTTDTYSNFNEAKDHLALVLTTNDEATLVLKEGDTVLKRLEGGTQWVGFQGTGTFTPVSAETAILPLGNDDQVTFVPASGAAAKEGLGFTNINQGFSAVEESGDDPGDAQAVSDMAEILAEFLDGAIIGFDGRDVQAGAAMETLERITLVRYESLTVTREGDSMDMHGQAALQIREGIVVGAPPTVGIVPLWGIVLWGIAVAMFIIRISVGKDKHHPVWDKLQWVGWIAAFIASAVVFWLWDREMEFLWGTSILTTDATGAALVGVVVLQLVSLALAGLFFGWPARIIIKALVRMLGQGRMANVAGVVSPFVTYVLGASIMLALVDALLDIFSGLGG